MKKLLGILLTLALVLGMLPAAWADNATIEVEDFAELTEAIAAAAAGDTIVLAKDIEVADTDGISIAKEVTIDLNGKNVDFAGDGFVVKAGGDVTIKGEGTVTAGKTVGCWVAVWAQGGKTTIQGGTWAMANVDENGEGNTLIYSKGGDITVEGGYFNAENTYNEYGGKPWYFVLNRNNNYEGIITVTGGTFEKYNPAESDDVLKIPPYLAEGYKAVENDAGAFVVEPIIVAAIGDKQFVSLQAAVDAAAAGDIITLVKDIEVADTDGISIAKKVTIDLNGKNVDFAGDGFVVKAGGDVTIKGEGTVTAGKTKDAWVAVWAQGGKTTIQGGTWVMGSVDKNGEGNTLIYSKGGDITVEGGYFNAENTYNEYGGKPWYFVLNRNNNYEGIITVTGGTFEKYNPAESDDVLKIPPYLAEGYVTLEKDDLYVVHKHTLTTVPAKDATCTEDGHTEYEYCSECDYSSIKIEIPANGHKMTKTAAKAATCTEDGNVEYYTCSVCKKTFADAKGEKELAADKLVVKSEGHKIVKAAAKEATYTADGNKEFYYCEVCKTAFADAEGKKTLTESEIKALVIPQLIKVDEDKAEVSEGAMDVAIEEAKKDKAEEVTLDLTHKDVVGEENVDAVTQAELPVAALEAVAEEEKALTLVKEDATVTLDVKALEAVTEQAKGEETVTLKVESIKVEALADKQQAAVKNKEVAVVITAELLAGDKKIATKDGKGFGDGAVTVAVPVPAKLPEGVKAADLKVYYVADDGAVSEVKSEVKDGKIVFTLTHFSEYVIAAEKPASPATGDNTNVALYGVLAIMSVLGMAVVLKKKAF